jgi:hypothetical protein
MKANDQVFRAVFVTNPGDLTKPGDCQMRIKSLNNQGEVFF